jgi:3-oxoadipate enol-lactonase
MQAVITRTTTLHVQSAQVSATAKTIVFIDSLGTDFRIWDGVIQHLGNRFNTVRHDKRGHGLSALGTAALSIASYANDVEDMLTSLNIKNIILCGLSVGGLIAQQLIANGKRDVQGLILSNTGLKIGSDEMWNSRIAGIEAQGIDGIADGVMERWFSPAFRQTQPDLLSIYRTMLARTPEAGYIACCQALRDCPAFDHSNSNMPPTLCIGGTLDGSTPPALVKALAANIPRAAYHEFEGAGHLPCIEQPERYADVITRFVDAIK